MYNDTVSRIAAKMPSDLPTILLFAFGLALIRVWRSWAFSFAGSASDPLPFFGIRDCFTLGTFIGAAACIVCLVRTRSLHGCPALLWGTGLATASVGALIVAGGELHAIIVALAMTCAGAGFSLLQATWIEWLSLRAAPLLVLFGYMLAWPVHTVIWSAAGSSGAFSWIVNLAVFFLPLASMGCVVLDRMRDVACDTNSAIADALRSTETPARNRLTPLPELGPCTPGTLRHLLPILAWTWLFTVAYWIGTSYTGMGSFSLATIAGEIAPVALLVAGYFALGERFDYTATYRIAFVALALGFGVTAFRIGGPAVAQACFSASNVIIMALTVTVICAVASLQRVSAAWAHSVLMLGWYAIALAVRKVAGAIGFPAAENGLFFVALALIALFVLALAVWKETDFLGAWKDTILADPHDLLNQHVQAFAGRYGLTEREVAVLMLLIQDKTYSQISKELFVALGTVRAHAGHIYEKVGVHSREELLAMVDGAAGA